MAEIIPFDVVDYEKELKDKSTTAFINSPVFQKYLRLLASASAEVQDVLKALMQDRTIDTAQGKQLDIIGDIVGQPRVLSNVDNMPFFGYQGAPLAQSYGDLGAPSVGGYYWGLGEPLAGNVVLNDDQYRLYIKSKIMRNRTRATPEDVIQFIRFVFNADFVNISADGGGHALIGIQAVLNQWEQTLLTSFVQNKTHRTYFIPKTLGVEYSFSAIPLGEFFAFQGIPNAREFGTIVDNNVVPPKVEGGGKFSSVI